MRRRELLSTTSVLLASTAGCLDWASPDSAEPERNDSEGDDGEADRVDTDESPPDGDVGDDVDRAAQIVVSNLRPAAITVGLQIVAAGTDETVLRNTYRIPRGEGARIPDAGRTGEDYEVTVRFEGREVQEQMWRPWLCPDDVQESRSGPAPASLVVWDDSEGETNASFGAESCDVDVTESDLAYSPHTEFVVDESD